MFWPSDARRPQGRVREVFKFIEANAVSYHLGCHAIHLVTVELPPEARLGERLRQTRRLIPHRVRFDPVRPAPPRCSEQHRQVGLVRGADRRRRSLPPARVAFVKRPQLRGQLLHVPRILERQGRLVAEHWIPAEEVVVPAVTDDV